MRILSTLVLLLLGLSAIPCGNEYGYSLDGERLHTRWFYLSHRHRAHQPSKIRERLHAINEKIRDNTATWKDSSDLFWNQLLLNGNAAKAVKEYRRLLKIHPKEYTLNANLGTAYELDGKLDSALKYIKEGYEINKVSHWNSEWIHVKILEAKIKEAKQPGWLKENRILPLDVLAQRRTEKPNDRWSMDIQGQIAMQIRTRVPFTPAPNAVIYNLLICLGEFDEAHGTLEGALLAYGHSHEFATSGSAKRNVESRIKVLVEKRSEMDIQEGFPEFFKSRWEQSKLDPFLLISGLREDAELLDSLHLLNVHVNELNEESMERLSNFENELTEKEAELDAVQSAGTSKQAVFGIGGILLGALLSFFLFSRKAG